jgi:hypothetical protein
MSEPTLSASFQELITKVAREAGIAYYSSSGQSKALCPIDVHDLELVKEIINDGIRMFMADEPPTGWRWRRRLASIAVTGTRITGTADSASATTIVDLTLATTYNYLHYVGTCTVSEFSVGETVVQGTSNATGLITAITATTLDITIVSGTADKTHNWTHGAHTFTTSSAVFPLEGYYIYITDGTGEGSYAVITGYNALTGAITVADWLTQYGNAGGTDPVTLSTFAITPIETVGGNISRYPLPEYFNGEIDGKIEYAEDSNISSPIDWRDESFIRSRRAISAETGYPRYAAIRQLEPLAGGTLGPKRRLELILDPSPSADVTLEFPYTVTFNKLDAETGEADTSGTPDTTLVDATRTEGDTYFVGWKITIIDGTGKGSYGIVTVYTGSSGTFTVADWLTSAGAGGGTNPGANSVYYVEPLNNLHPCGHRFDEVIIAACMSKAQQRIEEMATSNYVEEYHKKALMQAYKIDSRFAPRTLGSMNKRRIVSRIRNSNYVEFN